MPLGRFGGGLDFRVREEDSSVKKGKGSSSEYIDSDSVWAKEGRSIERKKAVKYPSEPGEVWSGKMLRTRPGTVVLVLLVSFFGLIYPLDGLPGSEEASNLVLNSPFIPADFQSSLDSRTNKARKRSANRLSRQIEFRGLVQINSEWEFCIYDTKRKRGNWVPLGNADAAYHVLEFFPETESIMVRFDGREEEIFLERSGGSLPQMVGPNLVQNLPPMPSRPPSFTPPDPPARPPTTKPPGWIPTRRPK